MSLSSKEKIKCRCGAEVECEIYQSVNIELDPELKDKALRREINLFRCGTCGHREELITGFLYNDMDKKLMIWVMPENADEDEEIDEINAGMAGMFKEMGVKVKTVKGYEGLFRALKGGDKGG